MKNAGAVLLPSQQLAELAERYAICLSGETAPAGCDIRYRQFYWLLLFDPNGELRHACRLGEALSAGVQQGFSVADAFVEVVDAAAKKPTTLQQAQRAYVSEAGSADAFTALREKLADLQRVGQLHTAAMLTKVAAATKDPVRSVARGLILEADACSHQVISYAAFARLREGIQRFLSQHPGYDEADDLVDLLVEVGMKYSFDVAARCRELTATWQATDSAPAQQRLAAALVARGEAAAAAARERLKAMKPDDYDRLRCLAVCGEARATLDALDATKSFGVFRPIHAAWRAAAKQRLRRAR